MFSCVVTCRISCCQLSRWTIHSFIVHNSGKFNCSVKCGNLRKFLWVCLLCPKSAINKPSISQFIWISKELLSCWLLKLLRNLPEFAEPNKFCERSSVLQNSLLHKETQISSIYVIASDDVNLLINLSRAMNQWLHIYYWPVLYTSHLVFCSPRFALVTHRSGLGLREYRNRSVLLRVLIVVEFFS